MKLQLTKNFIIIIFALFSTNLLSERVLLDDYFQVYLIENELSLYEDKSGELQVEELLNEPFLITNQKDLKANTIYWAKVDLEYSNDPRSKESTEWVLDFSLLHTRLDIYVVYPNNIIKKHHSGFFTPLKNRTYNPTVKGNFAKINLQRGDKVSLFFRSECERMDEVPEFNIKISTHEKFNQVLVQKRQRQGIFTGFVLMMLIYNIFLFFYSIKDKAYIYYSIYLVGILTYAIYNTGDFANWFGPYLFSNRPYLMYYGKLSIYITIVSYLWFLRTFLDLKSLLPNWEKLFKWMAILAIPVGLMDGFLLYYSNYSYHIPDVLTISSSLIFLLSTFIFAIFLFKTKDKKGYFVVVGILFMGIGAMITTISRIQSIDFGTTFFRIGIVLELIVFSLGLAYRKRDIERANQVAEFELEKAQLIQEREQLEAQRLKDLDDLKTNLYTNITHEFRTPLTVIMGVVDQVEGHKKEKALIKRNSHQLLKLINQMLDLAKIESQNLKMDFEQHEVIAYLKYLFESFHSLARAKNIELLFDSKEEELWMDIDESKLQHIVYNLISNAIKFSNHGGKVYLRANLIKKEDQSFLKLEVEDNGIGISEKEQSYIFDRFYQTESIHSGTGIGLALVQEIVNLWEGEIFIESKLNQGTKFTIHLPIIQNAIMANGPYQDWGSSILKTPEAEEGILISDKPILLLVEDNEDVSTYIKSLLIEKYEFYLAKDGREGYNLANSLIPDIIISDVMMPEIDGFDLTRILKKDEKTNHIPIILLTAKSSDADRLKGIEVGADAWLLKPFNKTELFLRLDQLHSLRKSLIEKFQSSAKIEDRKVVSETPKTLDEEFIIKVKNTILEHLDNTDLNIELLSESLKLSRHQLYRKLKAITGITPIGFIRQIRLNVALELLKTNDYNISEIAYKVGFNDPNYFSRVFYQTFSKSPSEYLNN